MDTNLLTPSHVQEITRWDDENDVWYQGERAIPAIAGIAWYAAPNLVEPTTPNFRPLDLAITLHNARLERGRALPHKWTHEQFYASFGRHDVPVETYKSGLMKEIEEKLEIVRLEMNPTAPSRMACYFVSADYETAQRRMLDFRTGRTLYKCRVLQDGPIHVADIRLFDKLTNYWDPSLAEQYWKPIEDFNTIEDRHSIEVLVGGSLYFPDWQSFPLLNHKLIGNWLSIREMCLQNNWPLTGWQHSGKN